MPEPFQHLKRHAATVTLTRHCSVFVELGRDKAGVSTKCETNNDRSKCEDMLGEVHTGLKVR